MILKKTFRQRATPQLEDYWRTSDDQEKIVLTVLALLERQLRKVGERAFSLRELESLYKHSTQTLGYLEMRGLLVSSQESTYSIFNTSFSEWICNEITDITHDQQSYEDWLSSNKSIMERISGKTKRELREILPRISGKYRELVITWLSDPRNLIVVVRLLKTALGFS